MFVPLPNKVLVEPLPPEDNKNGIILHVKKQTKHELGRAVSVGSECLNVTQNDIVVFSKIGNAKYQEDNKEYLIIDYDNILGVLSN